ncbi:uncharacterized protein TM35_002111000 [Trypanosoma theileri]|uniref:Uncharacterized protein n=1 Tax=Trypanosoma theileri TaxID=67003 RepID=A0A1X0NDN0_9TRYP|nr:uncharacterized protein TM35_002111000 [Trypanosoma theileri]ORC79394.1 hypothetical protein TM35_002111000 [Trypanosoma theileri]
MLPHPPCHQQEQYYHRHHHYHHHHQYRQHPPQYQQQYQQHQQQQQQQCIPPGMNGHDTSVGMTTVLLPPPADNNKLPYIPQQRPQYEQYQQQQQYDMSLLNRSPFPVTPQSRNPNGNGSNNCTDNSILNGSNNHHHYYQQQNQNQSTIPNAPNGIYGHRAPQVFISPVTGKPPVARGPQPDCVEPTRPKGNRKKRLRQHVRYRLPYDPRREMWVDQLAYTRRVESPSEESLIALGAITRRTSIDQRGGGGGGGRRNHHNNYYNNYYNNNDDKDLRRCHSVRPGGFVWRFMRLFK